MKRLLTALVVLGILLEVAASSAAISSDPRLLTYQAAVNQGLPVLEPEDLELPVCNPDPTWGGFSSPEEAAPVPFLPITDYPICVADPTQAVYVVGGPGRTPQNPEDVPPDPRYRWTGAVTRQWYMGGTITTEVVNPTVPTGDGVRRWTNARPLAVNNQRNRYVEAGWLEDNAFGDARYVYAFQKNATSEFETLYPQYPLVLGSYYVFRVQEFGTPGGAIAAIFWNGQWVVLMQNADLLCEEPEFLIGLCLIEENLENFNQGQDSANFPIIPSPGVRFGGSCTSMAKPEPLYSLAQRDGLLE